MFFKLLDAVGPYICIAKTHVDIISDFSQSFIKQLTELAKKHSFLLFEDRLFFVCLVRTKLVKFMFTRYLFMSNLFLYCWMVVIQQWKIFMHYNKDNSFMQYVLSIWNWLWYFVENLETLGTQSDISMKEGCIRFVPGQTLSTVTLSLVMVWYRVSRG